MAVEDDLRNFWNEYKNERFLFCTHKHADLDSVSSAYVLSKLFPNSNLAIADDLDNNSRNLLEKFNVSYYFLSDVLDKYDKIIAVDTRSKNLFPYEKIKEAGKEIFAAIDHHQEGEDTFVPKYAFVDENAKATAEIVAKAFPFVKGELAIFLACGILTDTVRFLSATEKTIETFMMMYKNSSCSYEELLRLAFPKRPFDEKIAILKGFQRVKIVNYKNYVIALSYVGSNNGETASFLAAVADISFVAQEDKENKNTIRVSARVNMHLDIEINKVMEEVGKRFNGTGGGHKKAAGCVAYGTIDDVLNYCEEKIKEKLDGIE